MQDFSICRRVISVFAFCHSVNLCILAARAFLSQQSVAVTRMWRLTLVQPSQKEHAIGAVQMQNGGNVVVTIQLPLRWNCDSLWIGYARRETNVARRRNNKKRVHSQNKKFAPIL